MSADCKMNALAEAREKAVKQTAARERLNQLFDPDTFVELDAFAKANGENAGVLTGYGSVEGVTVFAFAQDITEDSGAVGKLHAAKVHKIYDLAMKTGAPVVGIYDSNGGRIKEGAETLAAYSQMLLEMNNLSGVVPQISVIAGTCAGSASMAAVSADFVVMSEEAQFFMTAPSLAKAKGAEGVSTAAAAEKAGMVHVLAADDKAAVAEARKIVSMLPQNNLAAPPIFDCSEAGGALSTCIADYDAAKNVAAIADADSVVELQKGFGKKAFTALATLGGVPCGIVATCGGEICKNACDKIAKLVSVCDAYHIPVVTLLNASGFMADGEAAGSIRNSARLAHVYAEATTPKVTVITGEAYGPAYIALAGKNAAADVTLAWPGAVISTLAPETAVELLCSDKISAEKSREAVVEEYKNTECSPFAAAGLGYVDDVIDPATTRDMLITTLDMLSGKRVSKLPKKHSNLPL
ncbi:MAG: carboxyl transferase domain-containing protein [Oscillospiraceae bacterium]|nr:carboxyl transferase domain-containing protein [Oscillospiraceae bacterium]